MASQSIYPLDKNRKLEGEVVSEDGKSITKRFKLFTPDGKDSIDIE